jgi:lysozyme
MIDNVVDQIKRDEGFSLTAYRDSRGFLTIGWGHNLAAHLEEAKTCTLEEAEKWLKDDIHQCYIELIKYLPWVFDLSEPRRAIFVNMTFNLGIAKLLKFELLIEAASHGCYQAAATEMLNSEWAKQVGNRAERLAEQMRSNHWQ